MVDIPVDYLDRFEKWSFTFVSTLLPNGAPYVTPTWVDFGGEHVLVNVDVETELASFDLDEAVLATFERR